MPAVKSSKSEAHAREFKHKMSDFDRVAVQNDKTYTVLETGKVDENGDVTEIQKVRVTAATSMEKIENGLRSFAKRTGCSEEDTKEFLQSLSILNAVAHKGARGADVSQRERYENGSSSSSRSRSRNPRPAAAAARVHPPAPAPPAPGKNQ